MTPSSTAIDAAGAVRAARDEDDAADITSPRSKSQGAPRRQAPAPARHFLCSTREPPLHRNHGRGPPENEQSTTPGLRFDRPCTLLEIARRLRRPRRPALPDLRRRVQPRRPHDSAFLRAVYDAANA